jgi:hypothetical protein
MSKQLPKWFEGEQFSEGGTVTNPYSGATCELNSVELTVYARIINLERQINSQGGVFNPATSKLQNQMSKCLGWFRNNNVEAYYDLLD